jgi:hypothetical protein
MCDKINEHVTALIKLGVRGLVIAHDSDYDVYVLPAFITNGEEDVDPYLEYQVSNGLDGRRSFSRDARTYEEAMRVFADMVKEVKAKKQPNTPFWRGA